MRSPAQAKPTWACLVVLWSLGCGDSITPPSTPSEKARPALAGNAGECAALCTIIADPTAFSAAGPADSTDGHVLVGTVTVAGQPDDTVFLKVESGAPVPPVFGTTARVFAAIGASQSAFAPAALSPRAVVHIFTSSDTIEVTYTVSAGDAGPPDSLAVLQELTGGAIVLGATRPWIDGGGQTAPAAPFTSPDEGTCLVTPVPPTGPICGTTVTFTPVPVPAPPVPGVAGGFQSQAGTGLQPPLTVQFIPSVNGVSITMADPDFAGNQMVAFDSAGAEIGVVAFDGDGQPGRNFITRSRKSLTVDGIARIELRPAPGEYVAYDSLVIGGGPRVVLEFVQGTPATADSQAIVLPGGLFAQPGVPDPNIGSPPSFGTGYWPDTARIEVRVEVGGTAQPGKTVQLRLVAVDSSGAGSDAPYGHFHTGANGAKPTGTLSATSVTTGVDGKAFVTYRPGLVSGPIVVIGTSTDVDSAIARVRVEVPGLVELIATQSVSIIGQVPIHPINNFVTAVMRAGLMEVADSFFARYNTQVVYNDASLAFGGKFDLHRQWASSDALCTFTPAGGTPVVTPNGCHALHRIGLDIDVRTNGVSDARQRYLRDEWQSVAGRTVIREGNHNHFRDRR